MVAEAVAAAMQKRNPDTTPTDPSKDVRAMIDAALQAKLSGRAASSTTPIPATASNANNPTAEHSVNNEEFDAIARLEPDNLVLMENDLERKLIAEAVTKALLEYTVSGAGASADSVSGLAAQGEEYQPGDSRSLSFPAEQRKPIGAPAEKSLLNANPPVPTAEAKSPAAPLPRVAPGIGEDQFKEYLIVQDAKEGIFKGYGMIILLAVLGASTVVAFVGVIRGW